MFCISERITFYYHAALAGFFSRYEPTVRKLFTFLYLLWNQRILYLVFVSESCCLKIRCIIYCVLYISYCCRMQAINYDKRGNVQLISCCYCSIVAYLSQKCSILLLTILRLTKKNNRERYIYILINYKSY